MPTLEEIVDVSVSANTTTPSRPGFGTPLFLGYHTNYLDLVREYSKASDMVDDGFANTDALYLMAASAFAQNPRPQTVKIGRATTSLVKTMVLTITTSTEGEHILVTVTSPDGTETEIDYTVLAGASTTTVATAVEALIEACSGISSSASVADITVTAATGEDFYLSGLSNCTVLDSSGDADYDTALNNIIVVDNDWFGLAIVSNSEANIDDVADWAETNKKLFVAYSCDSGEAAGTGTIGSGLVSNAYDFTVPLWSMDAPSFPAAAWLGRMLPTDPGAATWIYKRLRGVVVDSLTTTQQTNLETDMWSYYITIGSRPVTQTAKTASGEFVDIIVGIEWLKSEIKLTVWDILSASDKVPYTDAGVAIITSAVAGVLQQGVSRGLLDPGDPENEIDPPAVTAPKVADVPTSDRANRHLPDVFFSGRLAGAIHKTAIEGTLTV
jgi:hypothetical protein